MIFSTIFWFNSLTKTFLTNQLEWIQPSTWVLIVLIAPEEWLKSMSLLFSFFAAKFNQPDLPTPPVKYGMGLGEDWSFHNNTVHHWSLPIRDFGYSTFRRLGEICFIERFLKTCSIRLSFVVDHSTLPDHFSTCLIAFLRLIGSWFTC